MRGLPLPLGPLVALVCVLGAVAAPARAQDPVVDPPASMKDEALSVIAGLGSAFTYLGVRAEFRMGAFAPFVGTGAPLLLGLSRGSPALVGAAGVRWLANPKGSGLFVSAHGTLFRESPRDGLNARIEAVLGLTAGWRHRTAGGVLLEGGLGPAVNVVREGTGDARWSFGAFPRADDWVPPVPDLHLAVGYEF